MIFRAEQLETLPIFYYIKEGNRENVTNYVSDALATNRYKWLEIEAF